jgi:hypothetical protein
VATYKISKAALEKAANVLDAVKEKHAFAIAGIIQEMLDIESLAKLSNGQLCDLFDSVCTIAAGRGLCLECWASFAVHNDDGSCVED